MLVPDFVEDLECDTRVQTDVELKVMMIEGLTHLILRVQHDFQTFVRGGDIRSELHTSCRTDAAMRRCIDTRAETLASLHNWEV